MKRISFLATLLLIASVLLSSSCGTGDKIGSVAMQVVGNGTGTISLKGLGGTLQLQVLAVYTSGKQIDETNFATYTIAPSGVDDAGAALPTPPLGIRLDRTAMLTATANSAGNGICTWVAQGQTGSLSWFFTGYYTVTATYRGFTSNPVYIPVASAANNQGTLTNGQCGP